MTDVDEPPENLILHYSPVHEGISDVIVGVFTADDPEGQTLTFQLIDPSNNFIVSNYMHMRLIW